MVHILIEPDINLNKAEYFDVNVWYDDREDVCFILVGKIRDYDPRDLYSAEKIAELLGKEFKKQSLNWLEGYFHDFTG